MKNGGITDNYSQEEKVELATKKNELYKTLIADLTPAQLFPGVLEVFDYLKSNDIKIALASASENAPSLLAGMGIADAFVVVVDPLNVPKGKPDPGVFLEAAKLLGFEPGECIGRSETLNLADVVYPHIKDVDLEEVIKVKA